jgi:nucleotide-binding universal stress UspA family protein
MKQFLVATDFSERSNRAVRRAGILARDLKASLILLHIVDDDRPQHLVSADIASAQQLLDAALKTAPPGVKVKAIVEAGDPFDGISRVARQSGVDLIIMGAHRKQLLREIFVGTSIERVTRQRIAPVLMVNTDAGAAYRQSVVAMDLSAHSGHALKKARSLGVLADSHVVVVHAFDVFAKGKMTYAGVDDDAIKQHTEQSARNARAEVSAFLDALGAGAGDYSVRVREGRPADVINEVANAEQADLVVLATHGRTGLLKFLLGSVTEEVMARSDRDVLVVPSLARDDTTV